MGLEFTEGPWDDPEFTDWADDVLINMAPKLRKSAFSISLWSGKHDVKLWVELGASIYMDKPIILLVFEDQEIPPKLKLVADEIVAIKSFDDPGSKKDFEEALDRMLRRLGKI
jgi:hypothetical protein